MLKIIGKKVEMLELFYDLVFVYAISKITLMIHHAPISATLYFEYVIVCLSILHIWLYQVNYINRYGKATLFENACLCINMGVTIYVANNINTDWSLTYNVFNFAMIIMILCVIVQFLYQWKIVEARTEIKSFVVTLILESLLLIVGLLLGYEKGLAVVLIGYGIGIGLPIFLVRNKLDATRTNFPHLVERMGLIIIVTFGEMIIHIAPFFDVAHSYIPVMLFMFVVFLFGIYVLQVDKLINHHQHTKGLVLLYSHFVLLIALGSITVGLGFLFDEHASRVFSSGFLIFSLLLFYCGLYVNKIYNKKNKAFTKKELLFDSIVILLTLVGIYIFKENNFLILALLIIQTGAICARMYQKVKNNVVV